MRRAPVVAAMALASSVLPTPAGPSTSTGFCEPVGEVHDPGDVGVGEVVDAAQALDDLVHRLESIGHCALFLRRLPMVGSSTVYSTIWPSPHTTYL